MISYEMKNLNMTYQLIYEIDELILNVLADSGCRETELMTSFNLLKFYKEPIQINDSRASF